MRIIVCFLLSVGVTVLQAQDIDSLMKKYAEYVPVEKIHIHADRATYTIGETIFYKAYLTLNGGMNILSKNLYVNWFDDQGICIKQTVTPISFASAQGSFEVPKTYTGGAIRLVAYTGWMLNEHQKDYLCERVFPIQKTKATSKLTNTQKTRVSLFPESGDLVFNLASMVAFKATDENGLPMAITGKVKNGQGEEIAILKTEHDGMGVFSFKPVSGYNYFIEWKDDNGKEGAQQIMNIKEKGGVLTVYQTNENAQVTVQVKNDIAGTKPYTLLIHQNQLPLAKKELNLADATATRISFPVFNCSAGILQFTLLNSENKSVAERIIFVDNEDHRFETDIAIIEKNVTKRGKNSIDIRLLDTTIANLSVAIYDAQTVEKDVHSIMSEFLLVNELKGYIHEPAHYVDDNNPKRKEHTDLLMLTHDWRRLNWESMVTGGLPISKFPFEQDFIGLKGKFVAPLTSQTDTAKLNMVIIQSDSSTQYLTTTTVGNNSFDIKNLVITDTTKIYYGFEKKKGKSISRKIHFENGFLVDNKLPTYVFKTPHIVSTNQGTATVQMPSIVDQKGYPQSKSGVNELNEVIVGTKVKTRLAQMDEEYTTGIFKGGDALSFDLVNNRFQGYMHIFNYLQGKVPGLNISFGATDSNSASPIPKPSLVNIRTGKSPLFFLDQVPILFDATDLLMSINISEIAYVKVFNPGFMGGSLGSAGGAIAIYSKRGNEKPKGMYIPDGLDFTSVVGYSKFKEFYSPTYSKEVNPTQPDIRKTIYWNPSIILSKEKTKQSIEFYNNDISKKLVIVLEGINWEGKMTRTVKVIGQ